MSHSVSHSPRSRLLTAAAMTAVAGGIVVGAPVAAMAASPVTPTVSCYWPNSDGSATFSIGYTNSGTTSVTYPVGPLNTVNPAPIDRGQPTTFLAGTHNNVWAPTVTAADLNRNPSWTVNGVAASYAAAIAQCPSKPVSVDGSSAGYLTATAAVVGIGTFVLASPRRRRALRPAVRATTPTAA